MNVPGWLAWLLALLAPPGRDAADLVGDVNEMHRRRVESHGPWVATLLTGLGAMDLIVALSWNRVAGGRGSGRPAHPGYGFNVGRYRKRRRWDMKRSLDDWSRDVAQAGRALARVPGFTAVTVFTLMLAIGANTAIFAVVDAVLLDPLDFPAADRLVVIRASAPGTDLPDEFGPAPEFYVQYSEQADMLEDLAAYAQGQTTVRADEQIDRLFVVQATPSLFTTLGVRPALGRVPTPRDERGGVMVISHGMWTTWFGADTAVVGRSYEVSGRLREVVGVMGPEWRFPDARTSVWVNAGFGDPAEIDVGDFGLGMVARTRPGVGIPELEGQLATLAQRLPERFSGPGRWTEIIEAHRPVVRTLEEHLVGDLARPLWLVLGTVGIVLLIACANVATLFSVRAEGRAHDLGVRRALGAGRGALVRSQMAEALLMAVMGGVGAVIVARIGLPLLVRMAPEGLPNADLAALDGRALLLTAGLSLTAALVFGLAPALRYSRARIAGSMRQSGHVGRSGRRLGRDALVMVQTASALVLLVGSGLLFRSFLTLTQVDPGYQTEDIFTFQVAPQREELRDGPSFARFHTDFMDRVAALPGVESVGLTNWLPLDEGAGTNRFRTEHHLRTGEMPPPMRMTLVGGDYFGTMGIRVLQGRGLGDLDHTVGPTNIVVGAAAAARLWPGEEPLGQRLLHAADTTAWLTVVGVVEDILLEDFRQAAPDPMVYLPMVGPEPRSWAVGSPAYVVRTARAGAIAPDVRALMRAEVPESPMYRVFTMKALADRSMAQLSFTLLVLGLASGLALVLGAVGLYGVLSYVVSNRHREIAVRMALGAQRDVVCRMVVLQGARMTGLGVLVGLGVALGFSRVLDSLLFGVETRDPPTFVLMSAVMIGVALLASYLPARRASSVDPMQSLRSE